MHPKSNQYVEMTVNDNSIFEYYSLVKTKKINWLWYPYIPFGKLTIVQGDPGDGKSTFVLDIIARLTNGTEMLALNIYTTAINQNDYSLGQAKAVMFFIILTAVSILQVRLTSSKEVEM